MTIGMHIVNESVNISRFFSKPGNQFKKIVYGKKCNCHRRKTALLRDSYHQ